MAVQYNKLFKMMIDRKMTNNQLAKQAGISLNIITRLKRDEYIAMQTIFLSLSRSPNNELP